MCGGVAARAEVLGGVLGGEWKYLKATPWKGVRRVRFRSITVVAAETFWSAEAASFIVPTFLFP
jgi:hypothetical protein